MLIWSKPTTYISAIYMHVSKDLIYHTDHVTVSLTVCLKFFQVRSYIVSYIVSYTAKEIKLASYNVKYL